MVRSRKELSPRSVDRMAQGPDVRCRALWTTEAPPQSPRRSALRAPKVRLKRLKGSSRWLFEGSTTVAVLRQVNEPAAFQLVARREHQREAMTTSGLDVWILMESHAPQDHLQQLFQLAGLQLLGFLVAMPQEPLPCRHGHDRKRLREAPSKSSSKMSTMVQKQASTAMSDSACCCSSSQGSPKRANKHSRTPAPRKANPTATRPAKWSTSRR